MKVLEEGVGPLFMDPDPDKARAFFREKSRAMVDKRMTVKQAVEEFVHDGDYLAIGGFGANRIPNAIVHEIVRQRRDLPLFPATVIQRTEVSLAMRADPHDGSSSAPRT